MNLGIENLLANYLVSFVQIFIITKNYNINEIGVNNCNF